MEYQGHTEESNIDRKIIAIHMNELILNENTNNSKAAI